MRTSKGNLIRRMVSSAKNAPRSCCISSCHPRPTEWALTWGPLIILLLLLPFLHERMNERTSARLLAPNSVCLFGEIFQCHNNQSRPRVVWFQVQLLTCCGDLPIPLSLSMNFGAFSSHTTRGCVHFLKSRWWTSTSCFSSASVVKLAVGNGWSFGWEWGATLHTSETWEPVTIALSSTLVGGEGRAGPSSLHTVLEGPTEYIWECCKMDVKVYVDSYMVTWTSLNNRLLEVCLT